MAEQKQDWINDVELEDVMIKWNWSHFDGRADTFNDPGDHNFTIILPKETALQLREAGWTSIKENDPYGDDEGAEGEWTMKVKISYKYEAPKIYLIKGDRKFKADESDLSEIRRDSCEQIDVIITPSRWVNGNRTGVTAYAKELYAKVRESRFAQNYADYEEV